MVLNKNCSHWLSNPEQSIELHTVHIPSSMEIGIKTLHISKDGYDEKN